MQFTPMATPVARMSEADRNILLAQWKQAKETLDVAKDYEMKLRKRIVDEADLFDPNKETGTETIEIGNGWKVKAVKGLNYKVANKEGEAFQMLEQLASLGELAAFKAKKLFRFDANLSITTYNELSDDERLLVDSIITTTAASPSLELVPPKSV